MKEGTKVKDAIILWTAYIIISNTATSVIPYRITETHICQIDGDGGLNTKQKEPPQVDL